MRTRALSGLILILISFLLLWWGSPNRTGALQVEPAWAYGFLLCFALGFVLFSMAALGTEGAYPALLSGVVLYFIVGALVAVFVYVRGTGLSPYSLNDAGSSAFWIETLRLAALWPLALVKQLNAFGWGMAPLPFS